MLGIEIIIGKEVLRHVALQITNYLLMIKDLTLAQFIQNHHPIARFFVELKGAQ